MNMKSRARLTLLLACLSSAATAADPYYTGNQFPPYPPGCVTLPTKQFDLYGNNVVRFWSGTLTLDVVAKIDSPDISKNTGTVETTLYRVGCAEPGRSVILVGFRLPQKWRDPRRSALYLPAFSGVTGFHSVPFVLKSEPNAWGQSLQQHLLTKLSFGDYTGGWYDARNFTWLYVLDVAPVGEYWSDLTDYYNGRFGLEIYQGEGAGYIYVDAPATQEVLEPNPALPLNGRLSGTWVEVGAADQGFLLSFSSLVPAAGAEEAEPENAELNLFLSWFTFDAQGRQLWLAGDARFPQGATEITIPIIRVANGQFLGPRADTATGAEPRLRVGEVRLKARSCNALDAKYDLASFGLGTGRMRLQRLDGLETAGYPCRDYAARLNSLAPQPGN
jgi:hypothetical protein